MQKFWNFQKGKYKAQSYSGKDACLFEKEVNLFSMMKDEKMMVPTKDNHQV